MKKHLIWILAVSTSFAFGQGFSNKTNTIHVDYRNKIMPTTTPQINWTTPRTEVTNSVEQSITFEADVHSDVSLRQVTMEFTSGGNTHSKDITIDTTSRSVHVSQKINLMEGENIIRLIATNSKGGKVSSTRSVLSGKDAIADAVDINRKDYALLFATDSYENWNDLVNPINDARTIAAVLRDKYG
ncbi:MAG TPA: hypothetical protein VF473_07200, partial [Cyclobacteriaceae bacterium]